MDVHNKVAIVTGGASGIGRATAESLVEAGAKVVIADINEDAAHETVEYLGRENAFSTFCDVGQKDSFETLKELVLSRYGAVDIVMNNAGILTRGLPEELPFSEWERVIDINLLSAVRSCNAFMPLLIKQGSGHIINTSSFSGLFSYAFDRLPYGAAKAALLQYSEGLYLYLKPKGIGVTCLCPGPVKSNIMGSITKTYGENLDVRGPGEQFFLLEAKEVGDMVVDAIKTNKFMLSTHPGVTELLLERAANWDAFLDNQIENPNIIVPAAQS